MVLLNNAVYSISIFIIANQELGGWTVLVTLIVDQQFFRRGEGSVIKHNHAVNPSPPPHVSSKYQLVPQ